MMNSTDASIYISGVAEGIYIYNVLVGALLLFSDLFGMSARPKQWIRKMAGSIFLCKGIAALLSMFGYSAFTIPTLLVISQCFDILSHLLGILFGFMLLKGTYVLRRKLLISCILPYLVILLLATIFHLPEHILLVLEFAVFAAYSIVILVKLYGREQTLVFLYSNTEYHSTIWYMWAIILTMAGIMLFIGLYFFVSFHWALIAHYVTFIGIDLYVCIKIIFQKVPKVAEEGILPEKIQDEETSAEGTSAEETIDDSIPAEAMEESIAEDESVTKIRRNIAEKKLAAKFTELIENDHIYTDADLTIAKVIDMLNTNTTYLYLLMHNQYHTTFFDYINECRIKKAKEMLADYSLQISAIGYDCGFNSPQSFTRAFRRTTGLSPREYRESLKPEGRIVT